MIERIKELEAIAKQLEPTPSEREHYRTHIINYTEQFLDKNENEGAYENSPHKSTSLSFENFGEEPIEIEQVIEKLPTQLDHDGINPASGYHLGYVPGGGLYTSSLGDYWTDITNRYAGVYFANPGAVRIENRLIRWMTELMGYPKTALGNLASGGSIANLIAVVTAREHHEIGPEQIKDAVIYLSPQSHHCILKALKIAGLAHAKIRYVDLDDKYRMVPERLTELILADLKSGLNPFLIVGSAGTTDTGAIDPLEDLAAIAQEHNIWYHVDGAYGAFFQLTEEGKRKLKGIELSDSLVLDPHKGLFLPYGLGVVLIREGDVMKKAFSQSANYLQDLIEVQDEVSPADVSPELTKPFRGLRLWLPLKLHGVKPFRAALEEKLLLAQYAYTKLNTMEGFVTGGEPQLSIVTFWYQPKKGDINEFNKALVKEIHNDGRIFISSTNIKGRFTLRFAILVFRTHLKAIDLALKLVQEKAKLLELNFENEISN